MRVESRVPRAIQSESMPFSPVQGAEPIPGYQLVERLGTGGYGTVWKATAPGGLTKAIKIVFGELGGFKAEQEMRALQRIKEVRHPFLLSLERIEIVEGQLLIVTELAEASLLDRFMHCRNEGLQGLPRDELLRHLRDTADALDYMSEVHGLQHLDIKPQNLLLVGGRIKVADFGLVKDLLGTSVTATGGVTPLYAPPEAFDGRISRFSDQYSLAIVYQEMLTGIRPFPGTTIMQLAQQHMNGRPLLDPLPPSDRPVIARAMAKTPQDRFPSCRDLVEQLLSGRTAAPPVAPFQPPTEPAEQAAMLGSATEEGQSPVWSTQAPTLVPGGETVHVDAGAATLLPTDGRIALRPTLFVGIGALAGQTLRRLKNRLLRHFGTLSAVPSLRLLLLDTDRNDIRSRHAGRERQRPVTARNFADPTPGPGVLPRQIARLFALAGPPLVLRHPARPHHRRVAARGPAGPHRQRRDRPQDPSQGPGADHQSRQPIRH